MPTFEETQEYFGFPTGASKKQKVEAIKEKVEEVKEAVKEPEKTPQQLRDIEMLERLGFPVNKVDTPEWGKKQAEEADKSLLSSLKKMGIMA